MAELHQDEGMFNESPPFADVNLFTSDRALQDAVAREGAAWAITELEAFGELTGSRRANDLRQRANTHGPALQNFETRGCRIDRVDYDPAYHELMGISIAQGLHCSTWERLCRSEKAVQGAHVARAAAFYLAVQMEPGHCCPITMTHASVAALRHTPTIAKEWLPKILNRRYQPAEEPVEAKAAVTLGMGMTERQGGTDVRAGTTRAEPAGDGTYRLTGHKWFLSAPMSDAFLILAQTAPGPSCFLVNRLKGDGELNGMRLVQLKNKLGNRSNASAEVEFENARGLLVGAPGRGIATIMDMVTLTRLDCAVSSAGLMRQAVARAIHHAQHRSVFQRLLIDQPIMTRVLADMALDVEGATALSLRLARAFDDADREEGAAFRRLMTPVAKFWVCKTAPNLVCEAMECMGGNGYIEDGGFPLLYREIPVNAIWEGSGNVMCLDVLRVLEREPGTLNIVLDEISALGAADPRIKSALDQVITLRDQAMRDPGLARKLVEQLALAEAAALLLADAPNIVSDAFLAMRLNAWPGKTYGAGSAGFDAMPIVNRAGAPH